jgi:hypothetical protein
MRQMTPLNHFADFIRGDGERDFFSKGVFPP